MVDLLALALIPSVLRHRRGRPLAALSWTIGLLALPGIVVPLWLLLGRDRLERKVAGPLDRRAAFCRCREVAWIEACRTEAFGPLWRGLPPGTERHVPTSGNAVDLLVDGPAAFPALEAAIAGARHSVELLYYIWKDDATGNRLADLLEERARAGVAVRLVVDHLGSRAFLRGRARGLRAAGVQVVPFLPVRLLSRRPTLNFRNHRKIAVVDGAVAFTGGMNVGDEYAGSWHDLMVRVRGPAAWQVREVFLADWAFATGEFIEEGPHPGPIEGGCDVLVLPSGPDEPVNGLDDHLFLALAGARRRAWIMTPYFVPNAPLLAALRTAAQRGVDVALLLPGETDVPLVGAASRAYLPELLAAGVRVRFHQGGVLHGKALLVDEDLAILGTANTDIRSLRLNFELTLTVRSRAVAAHLESVLERDLARGVEPAPSDREPDLTSDVAMLLSPLL